MSERLTVVHRQCMAVKEVTRSRDDFVTNQSKEVTDLYAPVTSGNFAVDLRQRKAVSGTMVPAILKVESARIVPEGLS